MKERIQRFMGKHGIAPDNILYIVRDRSKTCIHLEDGRVIETYFSMKNLLAVISENDMICINKGTAVSCARVVSIERGFYTMCDGRTLRGRVRTPGEHNRNRALMTAITDSTVSECPDITADLIPEKFAILDKMPLPFAVFELIFNDDGNPVDLLFRYLNQAMADLAGSTVISAKDRSFYDIFENGDKKWLEINAEVAIAGDSRSIRRFSPEIGRYLSLYYYCPLKGYCACALI